MPSAMRACTHTLANFRILHHLNLLAPSKSLNLHLQLKSKSFNTSASSLQASAQELRQQQDKKLSMDNPKLQQIIPALQAVVPPLSASRHKGQAGKVAVIGGCREYTGAPFFSAISALKVKCVEEIIKSARKDNIPLVLDGDGLFLITNTPELVCGYPLALLTPNVNEHKHLVSKMMDGPKQWQDVPDDDMEGQLKALAKKMGGVTIIQKGKADYISDGASVFVSDFFGSPRRCGGQGDVLSGSVGVFMTWARDFYETSGSSDAKTLVEQRHFKNPAMVAAVAGSLILRKAASEAYKQKKRSMVTTDIIEHLGNSMEEWFPA